MIWVERGGGGEVWENRGTNREHVKIVNLTGREYFMPVVHIFLQKIKSFLHLFKLASVTSYDINNGRYFLSIMKLFVRKDLQEYVHKRQCNGYLQHRALIVLGRSLTSILPERLIYVISCKFLLTQ